MGHESLCHQSGNTIKRRSEYPDSHSNQIKKVIIVGFKTKDLKT